jgi:hypothetical protein
MSSSSDETLNHAHYIGAQDVKGSSDDEAPTIKKKIKKGNGLVKDQ